MDPARHWQADRSVNSNPIVLRSLVDRLGRFSLKKKPLRFARYRIKYTRIVWQSPVAVIWQLRLGRITRLGLASKIATTKFRLARLAHPLPRSTALPRPWTVLLASRRCCYCYCRCCCCCCSETDVDGTRDEIVSGFAPDCGLA